MIDPNKQYRTRDGREVRIYAVDHAYTSYPVCGAINDGRGWLCREWTVDGSAIYSGEQHELDLIELKPRIKRTVWLNITEEGAGFGARVWPSKEHADNAMSARWRIACIPIEIDCEYGEGLE